MISFASFSRQLSWSQLVTRSRNVNKTKTAHVRQNSCNANAFNSLPPLYSLTMTTSSSLWSSEKTMAVDMAQLPNRFKPTPIQRAVPTKQEKNEDALFWKGLQFPMSAQEPGPVTHVSVCTSPPHITSITASTRVQIFDPSRNEVVKSLTKFKSVVYSGSLRSDGRLLLVGDENGGVQLIEVASKTALRTFNHAKKATHKTIFIENNNFENFSNSSSREVASFSDDGVVRIFDVASQSCVSTYSEHNDYVRAGCCSNAATNLLVSGSYDHKIKIFDRRNENSTCTMDHGHPVEHVLLLPNDAMLVSAGGPEIRVWDLLSGGRLLHTFSPHNKTVTCLGLSNGKTRLFSTSLDAHLKFHDLNTFETVHSVVMPSALLAVGIPPDDSFIAAGMSDGLLQFLHRRELGPSQDERWEQKRRAQMLIDPDQFEARPDDLIVKQDLGNREAKHDHHLRKFEHAKALDAVLKPYVQNRRPEIVASVLIELQRREALEVALGGRTARQLAPLMTFILKNVAIMRFTSILVSVSEVLLDLYSDQMMDDTEMLKLFSALERRVHRETRNVKGLVGLSGLVDLLLDASHTDQAQVARADQPIQDCIEDLNLDIRLHSIDVDD